MKSVTPSGSKNRFGDDGKTPGRVDRKGVWVTPVLVRLVTEETLGKVSNTTEVGTNAGPS